MTLAELRRWRGMTQRELADRMGVTQPEISRMERHGAHKISTVRAYVEGLGGRLEVAAAFPDRRVVIDL